MPPAKPNWRRFQEEAGKIGAKLSKLGRGLASASRLSGPNGGATVAFVEQNIDGFPGADAILSLVSEIARELEKKNTIQTQLKKMGCETEDWA